MLTESTKGMQSHLEERDPRIAELETRLAEAEETLRAIREGEVDALVVAGPHGDRIFTLEGADHPYRVLVEEMHEGTITLDREGLILYSNRQFAAMMKTGVENALGARMSRFLSSDQQPMFAALLDASEHDHSRGEVTLLAEDGTAVAAQISLSSLDADGMQNVCAVVTDLTERHRSEAIVKEEQLSRSILDQAAEAIIVIDAQGKIVRASESAQGLCGRNVLLQDFDATFELWSEQDFTRTTGGRLTTLHLLSEAVSGRALRGVEVNLVRQDGSRAAVLLGAGPLWSATRDLLGCVVTLTDITERKRSEEALAIQAIELSRSNADLRQFAYSASHDLQEPLRILAIYSQLLQKKYQGKLDAQADDFIRFTVEAAHRMELLVKDLLSYTQATDAPQPLENAVDAEAVLERTLKIFEAGIAEYGASIDHAPLPRLRVHEVHLQQLFQNLIGNALKYRSEAAPIIRVAAQREDGMWKLSVEDNGIGIEPRYQRQVFGLFKRLHGGGKYAGSGIGLAICQKIVERYGGRIWIESEPGKGSKFYFTLPGD